MSTLTIVADPAGAASASGLANTIAEANRMVSAARILVAVAVVLASTGVGTATDYYVSPDGNDGNDGLSTETPFKEIQTGLNLLGPGDTLYLMPGLHIPAVFDSVYKRLRFKRSGTAADPIRLTTTGPGVVIDLRNVTPGYWGFSTDGHNYIVVDGGGDPSIWDTSTFHLKITNVPGFGNTTFCFDFRLCHDVTLRNVWCDEAEQSALFSSSAYDCLIENVVASNDGINVNSHGIYVAGDSHNLTFRRFHCYGWGKHCIQFNGSGQYGHVLAECVLHDSLGNAIKNFSAEGVSVTNSFLYSANGFSENIEINRIEPNAGYDIDMTFNHCTFYSNYPGGGRPLAFIDLGSGNGAATFNNCVIHTGLGILDSGGIGTVTADYNLFYGGITPFGSNTATGDPAFLDADAGDLHIGLGSAALGLASAVYLPDIDIDGDPRPIGGGDLGADELLPALVFGEPPADGTLPKTQNNVVLLTFDSEISLPADEAPALTVVPVAGGPDAGGAFAYSIEPDAVTLKAVEQGSALTNETWYRFAPAADFAVAAFAMDLCTLRGDADDSGRVTTADYSVVKSNLGEYTDARADLNGNGRVTTADYSVVKSCVGTRIPIKP